MKRSRSVRRVLLGGLTAGALTATAAAAETPRVDPNAYYTNDTHIPGAGFYHAPFRGFYSLPYNHYDPAKKMYFYGGQWGPAPYRSIVNISTPTAEAARTAETSRSNYVHRSGFGSSSSFHSGSS